MFSHSSDVDPDPVGFFVGNSIFKSLTKKKLISKERYKFDFFFFISLSQSNYRLQMTKGYIDLIA